MNKLNLLARVLRKNQTPQEKIIWGILRNFQIKGLKFRRQYPIGDYIVDFVCKEIKLIIEIDGGQHNSIEGVENDKKRSIYLENKGYKILRFWNNDVDNNLGGVYETILAYIEQQG